MRLRLVSMPFRSTECVLNQCMERSNGRVHHLAPCAAFESTLVASNSRFDQWMRGNSEALTAQEKIGMVAFLDEGCADCHNGPMFSNYELHVLAAQMLPGHLSRIWATETSLLGHRPCGSWSSRVPFFTLHRHH